MRTSSAASHMPDKTADDIFALSGDNDADSAPNNVHGWLMGVHGYREQPSGRYENSMRIPVPVNQKARPLSIASISSEDSVNLDELIKANYTSDMDDETDLPDLAGLDLDDSDEEFFKLDEATIHAHAAKAPPQEHRRTPRPRSGSVSSENSMASQSTITFSSVPVAPSTASTSTAGSAPRSTTPNPPTPSMRRSLSSHPTHGLRSHAAASPPIVERTPSRLGLKRASHIPTPSSTSSSSRLSIITPQRTLSTSRQQQQPAASASRLSTLSSKRASHIPMTAASRARSPTPVSRMGTLGSSSAAGPRNSIFGARSPTPQSGLRPPSRTATSSSRSSSRLGIARRI